MEKKKHMYQISLNRNQFKHLTNSDRAKTSENTRNNILPILSLKRKNLDKARENFVEER